MTAALDYAAFDRWRADPIAFIEQVLCDSPSLRRALLNAVC